MSDIAFLVGVGGGFAALVVGALMKKRARDQAMETTGLAPSDLSHLPESLQRTALWRMAEGGFESGTLSGQVQRGAHDVEVTVFELETLRERRGEWAFLPVTPPFQLDGHVRVAIFRLPRRFPHTVLKRSGPADELPERTGFERASNLAAAVRLGFGVAEGVPAEMPPGLPTAPLDLRLPEGWRAYGTDAVFAGELAREPLLGTLADEGSVDEVIELVDDMIVIYQARSQRMRQLDDAGASPWPRIAQYLVDDGLQIVDAIARMTAHADPRGVHAG